MDSLERLEAELDTLKAVHQDAQSELVRLREELAKEQRLTRFAQTQSRDELLVRAEAAEARVAELKRELVAQELRHVRTREERAALDQARKLLEQVEDEQRTEWYEARHHWLRAHPATAPERQSIQAMVRADLVERERLGIERYGTALYPHNGRKALQDAYEEALDLAQYLKQALVEQSTPAAAGVEPSKSTPADNSCIYAVCKQTGECLYPQGDGIRCSLIRRINALGRAEKEQGT